MTRFVFIAFFLFQGYTAKAFQADSLYSMLAKLNGKSKIDTLIKIAGDHPEKKAKLANEAFELADAADYPKGKARAAELLGDDAYENQQFEKALDFYLKAYEGFTSIKEPESQLRSLKGLINAAIILKRYDDVISYCWQMLHYAEKTDNKYYIAYAYYRLGRIRGDIMKDLKGSREYSLKAIDLYLEINERKPLTAIYANLAIAYYLDQKYDSTFIYLNKGIETGLKFEQKDELHFLYSISGDLYYTKHDYKKALDYGKLALSISAEGKREDMVAFDNLLIGKIYFAKKQYETALKYAIIGTEKAEATKDTEQVAIGYELLSKIYKGKNDPAKAIEYLEKLPLLKDSIAKNSLSLRLAEKEAEFQIQKKQQELESLEKTTSENRLFRNGIILICILVIAILALFINRYTVTLKFQKQELNRLRTIKQLEEKEKLLLKEKLSHQEKLLASNTMHIIQKNQILSDLKSEISSLPIAENQQKMKSKIKNINRAIETNMTFEDDWQNFKLQFEQVYPNFFSKLYEQYPGLINNEIRFCAYIKMGHNTKEIAQLMGINASSVQKARYRLKKKMNLAPSINLIEYIKTF